MTDRELLELAAQAAGIPIIPCTCSDTRWPFKHDEEKSGKRGHWNPLEDDGSALRLAVRLKLHMLHNDNMDAVLWVSAVLNKTMTHGVVEFVDETDRQAAARRAIVRAAAEIGRTLQAPKATGRADSGDGSQKGTP